jgi:hypothetical protein
MLDIWAWLQGLRQGLYAWPLAHPFMIAATIALVLAYAVAATRMGPRDYSGNGITVGRAKQFDNRSLALVLEQLDKELQALNVLNQNFAQNIAAFQQQESTDWSATARLGALFAREGPPATAAPPAGKKAGKTEGESAKSASSEKTSKPDVATSDAAPTKPAWLPQFGVAAGDTLTDQINLAYQILNLRILNERALSDRLYEVGAPRLQTVLGFQVSIVPPRWASDCAAVAEIELKLKDSNEPIAIVAMIPQEKTYNAATLSSSASSLDGSVVSLPWKLGAAFGRRRNALFLHRDSVTVAFERNLRWYAGAFGMRDSDRTAFGRQRNAHRLNSPAKIRSEFRPVLGRRSVSPGARQMLAVAALPAADSSDANPPELSLHVRARTYWRRYHRRSQTTSVHWRWWPLSPNGPRQIKGPWYDLPILTTSKVETSLKPTIERLEWTDVGAGAVMVLVEGQNFFSGTEVTIGGERCHAGEGKLVLKSDRAMELHTSIDALMKGDAVLSGRFGSSMPLIRAAAPARGVNIEVVSVRRSPDGSQALLILILVAADQDARLRVADFERLPQAVIFLDDVLVPFPYWFENVGDDRVSVHAWTPGLKTSASVLFKVPLCGPDWAAWAPVVVDKPNLVRLGGGEVQVLLITGTTDFFDPNAHGGPDDPRQQDWTATLDRRYELGVNQEFVRVNRRQMSLTVPTVVLDQYDKLSLVLGDLNYLLDIPPAGRPQPVASLNSNQAAAVVMKGQSAIIDLEGVELTKVESATLAGTDLPFEVYAGGSRLRIFLGAAATANEGRLEVELAAGAAAPLKATVYVLERPPRDAGEPAGVLPVTPASGAAGGTYRR